MIRAVAIAAMARQRPKLVKLHIPRVSPKKYFLICTALIITTAGVYNRMPACEAKPAPLYMNEPSIRVSLADNLKHFTLHVNGMYRLKYRSFGIAEIHNSRIAFGFSENGIPFAILPNQKLRFLFPVKVEPIDSTVQDSARWTTVPSNDSCGIRYPDLAGQTFPGSMEIIPEHDGTFTLVNLVPLETYLRGVVPNELVDGLMPNELQAFMAQAIAARNFALYEIGTHDTSEFDVYSDTRDQVYSGSERYKPLADSAIALTSGLIVEYDSAPTRCFFHSTCGGHTENVQHIWQGQPALSYLSGVPDIDTITGRAFCEASPNFRWTATFTGMQLDKMVQRNLSVANPTYATATIDPEVTDIEIMDRFHSSRIDSLKITVRNRMDYFVRGNRIRYLFKSSEEKLLKSDLFDLRITRDYDGHIKKITLTGRGSGHGVGMCQWGALGMSRLGYSYLQILAHYYPGTEIKKLY